MIHTFQKYVIGFLCLFCIHHPLFSQEHTIVLHSISNQENSQSYTEQEVNRIEEILEFSLDTISIKDKKKRKYLEIGHKSVALGLLYKIENHELIFDSKIQTIVNQLAEEIYQANPQIPKKEISIWVSRSSKINAVTYMNGTIILYAGLITRLESMGELAFILCHEIAHYLVSHSAQEIQKTIDFAFSEETAKELKKINSSEYNRVKQHREFIEGRVYEKGRHSRDHELEADSIGLELLRRTRYHTRGAIQVLETLDKADEEIIVLPSLKSTFDNPDYAFRTSWLIDEEESFIMGSQISVFDSDSTKTHPDCKIRIQELQPNIDDQAEPSDYLSSQFRYLNSHLAFEIVEFYHDFGNYGRMIHEARRLLVKYPQNAYLKSRIGLGLLYIWQAQLNHEKGKVVESPKPYHTEGYAEILRMLNNMRLSELRALSRAYIAQFEDSYQTDEHFLFCLIKAAEYHNQAELKELKQQYRQDFPEGLYIHVIQ